MLLLALGCSTESGAEADPSPSTEPPSSSKSPVPSPSGGPVTVDSDETLVSGLNTPWGIGFLADGSALVTSRDTGEILHITSEGTATSLGTIPGVEVGGEGGLLGLTVAPGDNAEDPLDVTIYVYLSTSDDNRVLRLPITDGELGEPDVILDELERGPYHQGGRLAFGPDGMLYASVGDAAISDNAQDLESLNGKILRMTPDGGVPADNPFEGSLVYSYGHRNVQGLAFDDDGNLWASEFGANTWDELNLIEAGENYGWSAVEGVGNNPDYVDPQLVWDTEEASPSGIAYYDDTIFMCALEGQNLWQIPISDGEAGEPQPHFTDDYGRLRHVAVSPADDSLWVLTNNTDGRADPPFPSDDDDRIVRVTVSQSS